MNLRFILQLLIYNRYCIPTDNARLVTAAEEQFFDQINPNGGMYFSNEFVVEDLQFSVPVILIFTKFESQEANAFNKLQETCSYDDALLQAPHYACREFDQEHLSRFKDRRHPALEIVYLKGEYSYYLFIDLLKYQSHLRYA